MLTGDVFEMLQVVWEVPGDFAVLPDDTIVRIRHNDADHIKTLPLMGR